MLPTANRFLQAVTAACCLGLLAACGGHDEHAKAEEQADKLGMAFSGSSLTYDGDTVVVGKEGPRARIAPNGDLTIDGKAVVLDDAQRAQLVAYHATATQFRDHAKDVGMAGAKLGTSVVADVIHGIAKGDTSKIEENAKAKAEGVKLAALKLCEDLGSLRSTQQQLVATLPQFGPYAFVDQADVDDCLKDTKKDGPELATTPTPAEATANAAAEVAAAAAANSTSGNAGAPAAAAPADGATPAH